MAEVDDLDSFIAAAQAEETATEKVSDIVPEPAERERETPTEPPEANVTEPEEAEKPKSVKLRPNLEMLDGLSDETVERIARDKGWKPGGPRDARAFVEHGKDGIVQNKVMIEELYANVKQIKAQQETAIQRARHEERERVTAEFLTRAKGAAEVGDTDTVEKLFREQQKYLAEQAVPHRPDEPPEMTAAKNDFHERNPWYSASATKRQDFDDIYVPLVRQGESPVEAIKIAEERYRKIYAPPEVKIAKPPALPGADIRKPANPAVGSRSVEALTDEGKEGLKTAMGFCRQTHLGKAEKGKQDAMTKATLGAFLKNAPADFFRKGYA